MNSFACDTCEIDFSSSAHLSRHVKTKKHQNKLKCLITCDKCLQTFSRKFNYKRHLETIHNNITEDDKIEHNNIHQKSKRNNDDNQLIRYEKDLEILRLSYELKLQNCKMGYLERENKLLSKNQNDIVFIAKTTAKTANKAVNALTYAKLHYSNAPPLKQLDNYESLDENKELISILLHYEKTGKISDYLGDFLVKFYKKDSPEKQSLWSTDLSRLSFIVKQILKNNKSDWTYDKKGLHVQDTIINPLLAHIKKIVKAYVNDTHKLINNDNEEEDEEENKDEDDIRAENNRKMKLINDQQTAVQLIADIDNKSISKAIVRYIGPRLTLIQEQEQKQEDTTEL